MSDVLKQVEEALVHVFTDAYDYDSEEISAALTALRGLEWKEIAELDDSGHQPFYAGRWLDGEWDWSILRSRSFSMACGYTHFYRPVLPTPPKREGN